MAYGFKLTGVTIPENTTAINAVISDGTTPTEYALTGSIADGFSGTGASAVCTADGDVYDVDITVDAYTSEDVGDEYTINLSLPEKPTQSFSDAVMLVNGGTLEISTTSYPNMLQTFATNLSYLSSADIGEVVNMDNDVSDALSAEIADFVERASIGANVKIIAPVLDEGHNITLTSKIETYQTDDTGYPMKICSFRFVIKHLFLGISGILEVGCGLSDLLKFTSLMKKSNNQ